MATKHIEKLHAIQKDAEAYKRFGPLMGQIGMAVRPILETIAPNALRPSLSDILATKRLLNHFKTLSSEQFEYLTKLMTMSSADFLDEWFEFEPLKSTMSASGIIGTFMGPRSPGSAYVMLHHYMGDIDGAFRAWGSREEALVRSVWQLPDQQNILEQPS